jgi:aldose sugar dehydrogenase
MKVLYLNIIFIILSACYFNQLPKKDNADVSKYTNASGVEATTIASNLDVPWEITWGPDNKIWITE